MTLAVRSSDDPEAVTEPAAVVAAGALPWRVNGGGLQLLLIHRERYDDWSWPKGKIDPGETLPECAVREVREEVGLEASLGLPLPAIRYPVTSGAKVVYYWAAHVGGIKAVPDGKEVDAVRWVTPEQARRTLTNPSDTVPLEALVAAYEADRLETLPFIVVRHAKAKPRSSWTKEEGKRPLAATGKRQAQSVSNLLDSWRPSKVATSPWTRCVQTVTPYLQRSGAAVKFVGAITEDEHHRRPGKARRTIEKLLDKQVALAVCTHRPVLPSVLAVMDERLPRKAAGFLPAEDPYLRPGSVLVLQQSAAKPGKLLSVEIYETFED
ncbi:NUDIX hydrolase [Arthrobacter halodurans]|uniref:NUDIX domain-containing protein n=1 Tax=Arthrobacter halodurans TaxID=516699 RepID=A0ABV4UKF4_9MICC